MIDDVAVATTGGRPTSVSAPKDRNVPPPATALIMAVSTPAANRRRAVRMVKTHFRKDGGNTVLAVAVDLDGKLVEGARCRRHWRAPLSVARGAEARRHSRAIHASDTPEFGIEGDITKVSSSGLPGRSKPAPPCSKSDTSKHVK